MNFWEGPCLAMFSVTKVRFVKSEDSELFVPVLLGLVIMYLFPRPNVNTVISSRKSFQQMFLCWIWRDIIWLLARLHNATFVALDYIR